SRLVCQTPMHTVLYLINDMLSTTLVNGVTVGRAKGATGPPNHGEMVGIKLVAGRKATSTATTIDAAAGNLLPLKSLIAVDTGDQTIPGATAGTPGRRATTTMGGDDFMATEVGVDRINLPRRMVELAELKVAILETIIADDGAMEWTKQDRPGAASTPLPGRATNGTGRASEKLAIPSFAGEDSEDLGGSTRSYLRQIEAWRRMTYLPESQQGLVLYQNLTGKAWVAAEELSVSRLGSSGGVEYFVAWLNARFLDLEVARIGRAFSDFFRKLRRRNGQSIREYNSEYDRLHARLREVGCCLPQECAAWLYVDRLQLDEPQELNLLASVGNQYNLLKLQQAAVLHDRSHRKPWESKAKRPYTAHLTEDADGDDAGEDRDDAFEHSEGEEGIPEEVAVAYATYQSAKDKYREQAKARGYHGDRGGPNAGRDKGPGNGASTSRDDKIKLMKARSYCMSCGKKGHWHKDPECPNRGAKEVEMCHHVPSEVYALRHDGPILVGITDTACAKSVAGTTWLQSYSDLVKDSLGKPEFVRESEAFKFGTGKVHHSAFYVLVKFKLGDKVVEMKTSIINGDIPLLLSKGALAQLGMVYDVAANRASFNKVGLANFDL
ncbi:unnamed protein product, partial [Symbiodinium necroappetens]